MRAKDSPVGQYGQLSVTAAVVTITLGPFFAGAPPLNFFQLRGRKKDGGRRVPAFESVRILHERRDRDGGDGCSAGGAGGGGDSDCGGTHRSVPTISVVVTFAVVVVVSATAFDGGTVNAAADAGGRVASQAGAGQADQGRIARISAGDNYEPG